ncbi:MAG: holo-ACP synthase [Bacilli bacterium]
MGVGIDIVAIKHIKNYKTLAKKILSEKEYEIFLTKKAEENAINFVAGRYAAKEAFLKANKVGIGAINFQEISIINLNSGQPILYYQEKEYEVSISHEKEYAIAIVIL